MKELPRPETVRGHFRTQKSYVRGVTNRRNMGHRMGHVPAWWMGHVMGHKPSRMVPRWFPKGLVTLWGTLQARFGFELPAEPPTLKL